MDTKNNVYAMSPFESDMHRLGRLGGSVSLILILGFPLLVSLTWGIFPSIAQIWPTILTMWILMTSYFVSEMIAFPPILGPGSLYMCYITGNVQNSKIPCALSAMQMVGIKTSTEEGNAVAVVAVAVSSITTTVIIALGILMMVPMTPILTSPAIKPAFDNVVPAVFGALGGMWLLNEVKISAIPVVIAFIGLIVLKIDIQWVLASAIILSMLIARALYKKGLIGK